MNEDQIYKCLVSSRNILLCGQATEGVMTCLDGIVGNASSIKIKSSREVVRVSAEKAINLIKSGNIIGAGRVLNLIHNIPLVEGARGNWDVNYFVSIELPEFLEHVDEIDSGGHFVLNVCALLANP